jgi:hypothetical protein
MTYYSIEHWYFEEIRVGPFEVYIEGGWSAKDEELYFINAYVAGKEDGSFNVCIDRQAGIDVVRREVQVLIRRRLSEWAAQNEKMI